MIDEEQLAALESTHSDWCCAKGCRQIHTEPSPSASFGGESSSFVRVVKCPGTCNCETANLIPLIAEIRRQREVPTEPRVVITQVDGAFATCQVFRDGVIIFDGIAKGALEGSTKALDPVTRMPFAWEPGCEKCAGFGIDQYPGLFTWRQAVRKHFENEHGRNPWAG